MLNLLLCFQVVEEAGSDSKPKYLNELFILLRVVVHCPELAKLKGSASSSSTCSLGGGDAQLWEPFKAALAAFTVKGLGKQKDLKKSHSMLARLLGLALDETITSGESAAGSKKKNKKKSLDAKSILVGGQSNGTKEATSGSGGGGVMATKKKSKRSGDKEKKEAKARRMAASAEGFVNDVTFAHVDMDVDVAPEAEAIVAQEQVDERKKRHKEMKGTDTNGNQVEKKKTSSSSVENEKSKKKKKKPEEATTGKSCRPLCNKVKSRCLSLTNMIVIDCRRGQYADGRK